MGEPLEPREGLLVLVEVQEGAGEEKVSRPMIGEGEGVEGVKARAEGSQGLKC